MRTETSRTSGRRRRRLTAVEATTWFLSSSSSLARPWGARRRSTADSRGRGPPKPHLSAAQVGQLTFRHQVKGRADGSKDCDWSGTVQQRRQLGALQTGSPHGDIRLWAWGGTRQSHDRGV